MNDTIDLNPSELIRISGQAIPRSCEELCRKIAICASQWTANSTVAISWQCFKRASMKTGFQVILTTGDWNGDVEFDSGDLVLAFQDGGFEQGPRQEVNAVPEPTSIIMLATPLVGIALLRRTALHSKTHGASF